MKNENEVVHKRAVLKELIKPINIYNEEKLFEVQALCTSNNEATSCTTVNNSIDDEDDLLF